MNNYISTRRIKPERDRQREAEYRRTRFRFLCTVGSAVILLIIIRLCGEGTPPQSVPSDACAADISDIPLAPLPVGKTELASLLPAHEGVSGGATPKDVRAYRIHDISESSKAAGGAFPADMQMYAFDVCREYGIDYEIVFALIERESEFISDAVGDGGDAVGLMQIHEKWHGDRMARLGVTDLRDPYQNILVGVDFLAELRDTVRARGSETVTADMLAAYNYGLRGASEKLWARGVHIYDYNAAIIERAEQLRSFCDEGEGGGFDTDDFFALAVKRGKDTETKNDI